MGLRHTTSVSHLLLQPAPENSCLESIAALLLLVAILLTTLRVVVCTQTEQASSVDTRIDKHKHLHSILLLLMPRTL